MSTIPQSSFTSGEISPSLHARVDFNKYYSGLHTCRNFIVRPFGGVANRPGSRFIREAKDSTQPVWLIPFQFSTTQTYILEFGNLTMRVIKDGAVVLYPDGHPSAGQPVEIVTIYPASVLSRLSYAQTADVMTICHPDYPVQQLSRTDHHLWSFASYDNLFGPFNEINVDSTKTVRTNGTTGNITITASNDIFTSTMVGQMIYLEQSPDALTKKWEVAKPIAVNDIKRAGSNYYKAISSGTTGTVRPDHVEGLGYDGDPGVQWQYLHSGSGIVLITGYTSAKVVAGTVLKTLPDQLVTATATKNINGLTPSPNGAINVKVQVGAHGWATGDSVTIASVGGTTGANGVWQIIVIDASNFELSGCTDINAYTSGGTATKALTAQPSYKWAIEAWGGADKYPATVGYYQQRQVFGASYGAPQTIWLSVTGGYTSFEESVPSLDTDAITFTIASREVNEVRHFVELSELVVLTNGGEWVARGNDNGVLTPSGVTIKRQGFGGANHLQPVIVGNQALYVQEKGSQVRSLSYSLSNDAFVGNDLTVIANHLFANRQIVSWCYQQTPFQCVWAVRNDGALLGLSYMPEHEVAGWHRHDTDGYYESVACVSEGNADVVYAVVRRVIGGVSKRYIERFDTRQFATIDDAFFVDSGLSYTGVPASTFSGLDHLEGKTVSILADGFAYSQQVVTGGSITLEREVSKVHIGLPITADLMTLPVATSQGSIRDKNKLIHHVSLQCEESLGVKVGPDVDHLTEVKQRTSESYGEPATLLTGLTDLRIQCNWNKNGQLVIRQDKPLPITILSIMPEVTVAGA